MEQVKRLGVLLKFFEFGNHIIVNNGIKIYMKDNGELYMQKGKKKAKKYNPTYNELLQLTKSINEDVYSKILNVVNYNIFSENRGGENNEEF